MLDDNSWMTFGKYGPSKGDHRMLKDVPSQYLLWFWDKVLWSSVMKSDQPLKEYVLVNYKAIIMDVPDYIPEHPPV